MSDDAETVPDAVDQASENSDVVEPPKKPRRKSTSARQKKTEDKSSAASTPEVEAIPEAANDPIEVQPAEIQEAPPSEEKDTDPDKPKKTGWWSKALGRS